MSARFFLQLKPRSDLITDASGGQLKKKGSTFNTVASANTYTYEVGYNPNLGVVTQALGGRKGVQGFMSVDPLADQFPGFSPYNYTLNNPINMIEPDGRAPEWVPTLNEYNSITYISEQGDSYDTFVEQYGETAARNLFASNGVSGGLYVGELAAGEVSLTGELYPLRINREVIPKNGIQRIVEGFFGASDSRVTTPAQQIYNQMMLAEEAHGDNGTPFNINNYLTDGTQHGGRLSSFSTSGNVTTSPGNTFRSVDITYDSMYARDGFLTPKTTNPEPNFGFYHYRYLSGPTTSDFSISINTKNKKVNETVRP